MNQVRGVAQLVAHAVWDREVAGSSPVAPTIKIKNITPKELFFYFDTSRDETGSRTVGSDVVGTE